MGKKNYLNNAERHDMLHLGVLFDRIEKIIVEWEGRGNLEKEEKKAFKTALTWGIKGFESIIKRQNKDTLLALDKATKNAFIYLDSKSVIEELKKKKKSDINLAYEENKDYYRLVELIFDNNCKDCRKYCEKCDIFKELEAHYVPCMNMESEKSKENNRCKYSFTLEDIEV